MAQREKNLNEEPSADEKIIPILLLLTASCPVRISHSSRIVAYRRPILGLVSARSVRSVNPQSH